MFLFFHALPNPLQALFLMIYQTLTYPFALKKAKIDIFRLLSLALTKFVFCFNFVCKAKLFSCLCVFLSAVTGF